MMKERATLRHAPDIGKSAMSSESRGSEFWKGVRDTLPLVIGALPFGIIFLVVHELFMTDTALWADIILPGASFLEMTDIYTAYGHNYLRLARPVIAPVGQSRSNLAIFQAIAKRMGYTESVFSLEEKELIRAFVQEDHPSLKGFDHEAFWQEKAVRLNIPANPYADGFNTPSGKAF